MPNRLCLAVSAFVMLAFAGGAGALDMPPPAQDVLDTQRAAYEARGTKTILDLQPFRSAQSVDLAEGGAVTLISLNPAVRAWFLLELRGADGQTAVYHLENPDPARRGVALEVGTAPALVVGGDGGTETCTPWEGAPSALEEARDSGLPYAPLCGGALHLRNDVAGSRTSRERVAEFLRDNVWFGEEIVGLVKRTFYDDAFLRSGETRDDVDPGAIVDALGQAPMADRPVMSAATGIEIEGGERSRMEMGSWYAVKDAPGVYASVIHPGRIHPDILNRRGETNALDYVERAADTYLLAFDLTDVEIGYERGTEHPRLDWSPRPQGNARDWNTPGPDGVGSAKPLEMVGMLNPAHADRVIATFNGGFKREHGAFKFRDLATYNGGHHYGFVINGVVLSKLQPSLATLYTLTDGTIGMKAWEEADNETLLPRIRFARQNGVPLIVTNEQGESVPGDRVRDWLGGNWYGNANAEIRTVRSGICLKEAAGRQFLIFGYFSSMTPSGMARTFQAYGCSDAMQLDMNSLEHTYGAIYVEDEGGGLTARHIASQMAAIDAKARDGSPIPRFVGFPDNRDFFYLLRKVEKD